MYIRFSQDLSYSILKNNSTPPPAILFIEKELSEFGINDAFVYHDIMKKSLEQRILKNAIRTIGLTDGFCYIKKRRLSIDSVFC